MVADKSEYDVVKTISDDPPVENEPTESLVYDYGIGGDPHDPHALGAKRPVGEEVDPEEFHTEPEPVKKKKK